MDVVKELTKVGKDLGLEGEALNAFVSEQQVILRDERQAARDAERERREAERISREAKEKAEREIREMELRAERERHERELKAKADEQEKQREIKEYELQLKKQEIELKRNELLAQEAEKVRQKELKEQELETQRALKERELEVQYGHANEEMELKADEERKIRIADRAKYEAEIALRQQEIALERERLVAEREKLEREYEMQIELQDRRHFAAMESKDNLHEKHQVSVSSVSSLSELSTVQGMVEEKSVEVLRDTGCSGVIVSKHVVPEGAYTGRNQTMVMVDYSTRVVPEVKVNIDTPYYKGEVLALCVEKPLVDLIIGNIPGARERNKPDIDWVPTLAVQTRAQKKQEGTHVSMKTPEIVIQEVTPDQIRKAQNEDQSLKVMKARCEAKECLKNASYFIKNNLMYRKFSSPNIERGRLFTQLIVPQQFRKTVMKLAHESIMAGHLAVKRTIQKVLSEFYWPGISSDIKRFCQSCDICQRTVPKGKIIRAPLGKMPRIDVPFKRVATDLIGPLKPVTYSKNRFILTVVDYATRYPEAVPLASIDTETVADALVSIFNQVGVTDEISSDLGSQFTSSIMKEVSTRMFFRRSMTGPHSTPHSTPYTNPYTNLYTNPYINPYIALYTVPCTATYSTVHDVFVEHFRWTINSMLIRIYTEKSADCGKLSLIIYRNMESQNGRDGDCVATLPVGASACLLPERSTEEKPAKDVTQCYAQSMVGIFSSDVNETDTGSCSLETRYHPGLRFNESLAGRQYLTFTGWVHICISIMLFLTSQCPGDILAFMVWFLSICNNVITFVAVVTVALRVDSIVTDRHTSFIWVSVVSVMTNWWLWPHRRKPNNKVNTTCSNAECSSDVEWKYVRWKARKAEQTICRVFSGLRLTPIAFAVSSGIRV